MLNCYHLGDASALQAATINVGLLLVLAIIFHSTHEENAPVMRFAFLVIFTIPVWLNLVGFCFAVRGTSMSLISNPQDEWKLYSLLFTTPSYETGELVSNARKNLHTLIICGFISSLAYYGSRYVFGNDNESLNTSQKQESEKTD